MWCEKRLFGYDLPECGEYEPDVVDETCVGHIFEIDGELVGHHLLDICPVGVVGGGENLVLIAVSYRCQGCDAGPDLEHSHLLGRIHVDISPHLGARPHERHVADEHVDKLRQLVELVLADIISGARHPRVMSAYGYEPPLVGIGPH